MSDDLAMALDRHQSSFDPVNNCDQGKTLEMTVDFLISAPAEAIKRLYVLIYYQKTLKFAMFYQF